MHPIPTGHLLRAINHYLYFVLLESCVRAAQRRLTHVPQTMLDVVRKTGAIRDEPDAEDV